VSMSQLLLIQCVDQPGLIHQITGVLFRYQCNIISNHEFVDSENNLFFMRTEFTGAVAPSVLRAEIEKFLPCVTSIRLTQAAKRPVVVLATKEPHCLGDLLLRHAWGELPAQIKAIVANHDTLASLAKQFGIPFVHVPHVGLSRVEHEAQLQAAIAPFAPEFLILAKYMRVLSPDFVARWPARIINIHHSFLPAFIGANPYRQAYERGVKIIGATAHFVTNDLDEGPIIAQDVISAHHSQSATALAQVGRDVEKIVLSRAVRLVLEERVFIHGKRTVVFE
jgi:formyltetrahydrofolate deformylase